VVGNAVRNADAALLRARAPLRAHVTAHGAGVVSDEMIAVERPHVDVRRHGDEEELRGDDEAGG